MAIGRTNTGGGASLNYKIIGGTSRPSSGGGDTLTWDGNTEGLVSADFGMGFLLWKISDVVPTEADVAGSSSVTYSDNSTYEVVFMNDGGLLYQETEIGYGAMIIPEGLDGFSAGIYFPKAGESFVSSLTIPGYTGFGGGASVKDNTIWVDTSTKITSHAFSATEPENPVEGMVWFQTGMSSNAAFNALKKNSIEVYPTGCKQYVVDAWVAKTAETYMNGKWVDWWNGELYDSGNEYTGQTGGWVSFEPLSHGSGTMTKNADNLYVQAKSGSDGWRSGAWGTAKEMNLSKYTTLHIEASTASGGSGDSATKFGITDTKNTSSWNDTPIAVLKAGENTLDISTVDKGYIWFGAAQRGSGTKTAAVIRAWLT